jgi:RNA polymerase sigma factor (sigma-70 family)
MTTPLLENIEIVGEAADGIEALEKIKLLKPNIVLLDLTMPKMSGIEVAKVITEKYQNVKTIIFSMHNNQEYMISSVENGAMGYLLKDTSKEEILKAINTVSEGKKYFPSSVSATIIDGLLLKRDEAKPNNKIMNSSFSKLSKKEKEILRFVSEGLSSKEIAEKLGLSIRTVSNHRANIIKKTEVKNTADLIKQAVREKRV